MAKVVTKSMKVSFGVKGKRKQKKKRNKHETFKKSVGQG
jgi:hypothetical protein